MSRPSPTDAAVEANSTEPPSLWSDDRLADLATRFGTPLYAYDAAEARRRVHRVRASFGSHVGLLYAVKANPLPALLAAMRPHVDGLDVASGGEVELALAAGFRPDTLRLAGPGKRPDLLKTAAQHRIPVSVESPSELASLAKAATAVGHRTPVILRLEPPAPIRAFGVQMGHPTHPFGMNADECRVALRILADHSNTLRLQGVHVYSGSQCRSTRAWLLHLRQALDLAFDLTQTGLGLPELNIGGGFAVATADDPSELDVETLGPKAARMLDKFACAISTPRPRFVLELGRFLVADAGVYLCRVLHTKVRGAHTIAVLDGGVHHLWAATGQLGPRPRRRIVDRSGRGRTGNGAVGGSGASCELMGPLCTPLDHLGSIAGVPQAGDIVAFDGVGAYGATFSPVRLLGHPPPTEVLLDGPAETATPTTERGPIASGPDR